MVIVKSKLTGKFLRQHSGSANHFNYKKHVQVRNDKDFMAGLPKPRRSHNYYIEPATEAEKAVSRETHNRMYDAEALEARRYANQGSALNSIGKWNREKGKNVLPAYLEIHEIVAGNLCLVNSDDSEETKRRKKEDCR